MEWPAACMGLVSVSAEETLVALYSWYFTFLNYFVSVVLLTTKKNGRIRDEFGTIARLRVDRYKKFGGALAEFCSTLFNLSTYLHLQVWWTFILV